MSLLNFCVDRNRAVVVADTAAGLADGTRHESSKLLYLPHAGVLFACRGFTALVGCVFAQAYSSGAADFDQIDDLMPGMLQAAHEAVCRSAAFVDWGSEVVDGGHHVLIVGWSGRHGRMVGVNYTHAAGAFTRALLAWMCAPSEPKAMMASPPSDEAALTSCARAQVRWIHEHWDSPGTADGIGGSPIAGGRLLVAELTRHEVSIKAVPLAHARAQDRST